MSESHRSALKHLLIKIAHTVYDPRKNSILGREPLNWAQVLMFYLILFLFLSLFSGLLLFLAKVILENKDLSKYDSSILGSPGLLVYPLSSPINRILWLNKNENIKHVKKIDSLLKDSRAQNVTILRKFSFEKIENHGPCSIKPYGYEENTKSFCVYLTINKILNWVPDYYTDPTYLPLKMPNKLRSHIQTLYVASPNFKKKLLWVSCYGQHPIDKDNIDYIEFFPHPGFESTFFPFRSDSTSSPIVGVLFYGVTANLLLTVKCNLYAKNIPRYYNFMFQIYVEND